jgi:hypothetical protein
MDRDGREAVEYWFDYSSRKRNLRQPLHGVTPDFVLSELVRSGDGRARATSMTTREPQQEGDQRAPGEGEFHGGRFHIQTTDDRRDPAYDEAYRKEDERAREFQQAIDEADVDPVFLYPFALQAAVDEQVGFFDRRASGRRFRPESTDELLAGPQAPYAIPEVDPERYRSL